MDGSKATTTDVAMVMSQLADNSAGLTPLSLDMTVMELLAIHGPSNVESAIACFAGLGGMTISVREGGTRPYSSALIFTFTYEGRGVVHEVYL